MSACVDLTKPDEKCSSEFLDSMDRKSDELNVKLLLMGITLSKLSGTVLDNAEHTLSQRETWYRCTNIASVFLFTPGWSLGLVGTLFHVRGLAPDPH